MIEGTVVLSTGGFYDVDTPEGVLRCRMRGRLKKEKKRTDLCVIGDRARVTRADDDGIEGWVEEVLPRQRVFSRRHPGKGGRYKEDVLVANLDRLVCVFAFRDPPFHARMLDRFIVIAEHNDVRVAVVANKADQVAVDPTKEDAEQRAVFERYRELGYPLFVTSAVDGRGVDELRELLDGELSALTGPSGTGKSSLINLLIPDLDVRVAETSTAHGKGRHTTRVAQLHAFGSGYIADTPGIRELGAWALPDEELDACFVEFRPFLGECGFRNCRHLKEPKCAIKAAVESGSIHPERYESYARMVADEER